MTKQKSTLENALEEAIEEIETEKKEIATQIKQLHKELKDLDRKISDYRVVLNHAKGREDNTLTDEPFTRNHNFTYPSNKNPQVLFSGSGAYDAMRSWEKCNDCIKSVENACLTDVYTGGSVKFLNVLSLEHNILSEQTQLSDLFDLLKERGFVMRKHAKQLNTIAEPIKTAMNDPEILKDVNGFSSGEASFEAPAPEAMIEWQENEIQELSDFFQSCNK